ncbi:MAG: hypothetical protein OXE74_08445, partial [Cyanobacteria bacterium MAG CAR2_bin_4]|nr:hypothetical protein [Cyanobacteria bacterium MAG CAR2_bin_4]
MTPAVALALSPTTNTTTLLWSLAPYSPQQGHTPWQSLWKESERNTPPPHSIPSIYVGCSRQAHQRCDSPAEG